MPPKPLKPYQEFLRNLRGVVAQVRGSGVNVLVVERVEPVNAVGEQWHISFECEVCRKPFQTVLHHDAAGNLPPVVLPAHKCAGPVAKPGLLPL